MTDLDGGNGLAVENFYRRNATSFDRVNSSTFDRAEWFLASVEKRHKEIYVLQDEQYREFLMNSKIGG